MERLDIAKIRWLRENAGMTMEEVGDRVGVTMQHISHIERGLCEPSVKSVLRIANALGVTVGELFTIAD